jgi:hypothetical protein
MNNTTVATGSTHIKREREVSLKQARLRSPGVYEHVGFTEYTTSPVTGGSKRVATGSPPFLGLRVDHIANP